MKAATARIRIIEGRSSWRSRALSTLLRVASSRRLQQDADIRWMGNIDDLVGGDDPVASDLRAAFRSGGDGAAIADGDRDAFLAFLRERFAQ